jgi:hypothetical protein
MGSRLRRGYGVADDRPAAGLERLPEREQRIVTCVPDRCSEEGALPHGRRCPLAGGEARLPEEERVVEHVRAPRRGLHDVCTDVRDDQRRLTLREERRETIRHERRDAGDDDVGATVEELRCSRGRAVVPAVDVSLGVRRANGARTGACVVEPERQPVEEAPAHTRVARARRHEDTDLDRRARAGTRPLRSRERARKREPADGCDLYESSAIEGTGCRFVSHGGTSINT